MVSFFKVTKKDFLVLIFFLSVFVLINYNYYKDKPINNNNYLYQVKLVKQKYAVLMQDENNYLLYLDNKELSRGDLIYSSSSKKSIKGTYNEFYQYLNKQNVSYILEDSEFTIYQKNNNLLDNLLNILLNGRNSTSVSYLRLILFNDLDEESQNLFASFSALSLSHLLAISGYQISLLYKIFDYLLAKLGLRRPKSFISSLFIVIYLIILNFSFSSYRAFLYYVFKKFINKTSLSLGKIEILLAIGICFLFMNPSFIFSTSFIFSLLFSFFIEQRNFINNDKIRIKNYFKTIFDLFLVSIPLILLQNYQLNIFSLFISFIFIAPVSYLYIFSLVTLFLDKFDLIYRLIIEKLTYISEFIEQKSIYLVFGKPSIVFFIVYYFLLVMYFITIEKKELFRSKYIFLLFFLLSFKYSFLYFNPFERVTFLNVGQGDCSILFIPHSKKVVLIDTGGSLFYDVAQKEIIPYLKKEGILGIEKVIITHDDYDHNGALDSLINAFKVEEVIFSIENDQIKIGRQMFTNLNKSNKEGNDGSIALYGEYVGKKFFFSADITQEIENNIIKSYPSLKIDVLKVSHHGSKSSSSEDFIKHTRPSLAIISVGKNYYGHPSNEVISVLRKYQINYLRTDVNNDIEIKQNLFIRFILDYFN